ncbi:Putative pre-16S rRNA nuclease [Pontivivens insulae]|uniref:Putative pre-16S rRNA nuclease n=2 Tax=Pontivivens insulae TaxID=1639689 RepID=A0A2R8A9H1_9RHOB|nr:putative Holliday junction resolvase [Pontivivens insulae]SPF28891.1 Putative pre-16S rRNA nuclease [Pontivivens insulae]
MTPHETAEAFLTELPGVGALMGLDPGTKTIGVAISDPLRQVASPLETIRRKKFSQDALRLDEIIANRSICGVVIGLPLNMDGSEGPRAQSVRAFARNLAQRAPLPILFQDERLSSVAAERALLEADTSRAKRSQVIDNIAASYILQGALDRINFIGKQSDDE